MPRKPIYDRPARKARSVLGGSGVLLGGLPDLSFPRQSRAYKQLSLQIEQLVSAKRGGAAASEAVAAAAGTSREAHPVGNTGSTSKSTKSGAKLTGLTESLNSGSQNV